MTVTQSLFGSLKISILLLCMLMQHLYGFRSLVLLHFAFSWADSCAEQAKDNELFIEVLNLRSTTGFSETGPVLKGLTYIFPKLGSVLFNRTVKLMGYKISGATESFPLF